MNFLNTPIFDSNGLLDLTLKSLLNRIVVIVLIRLSYYNKTKQKDYIFTLFVFNLITFLICYLLQKVNLELGFALGLFAVFGILRYRTETLPIKEMTYLFIIIGIAMINSLSNENISWSELLFANFAIVFLTFGIEFLWFKNQSKTKIILFEKTENIQPENQLLLIEELKSRTGLNIIKLEIISIDFLKDSTEIKIFYLD